MQHLFDPENLIYWFFLLLAVAVARLRWTGQSRMVPSLAISLGIGFTFVGIYFALQGFDVSDIQGSIPELLGGMKLAFSTSIWGMGVAFAYRLTADTPLWRSSKEARQGQGATIDTLAAHLQQIGVALVGSGDSTLHTQIQKLRLTVQDKQDELIREFRAFAENMTESNTQALIEAIEQVMRDFNTAINEQLGESFRQFNEGLGRMLTWQEEYKEQVEEMADQFDRALEGVEACEQALARIEEQNAHVAETAEATRYVIAAYHAQIQGLQGHLQAFAAVADKAGEAFPAIEANLTRLTDGLKASMEAASKAVEEAAEVQRAATRQTMEAIQRDHAGLSDQVRQLVADTRNDLAKQTVELDKALGEELTKSLNGLGQQMASLSSKFVADYTPLTDRLRQLVEAAGRTRGDGGMGAPPFTGGAAGI